MQNTITVRRGADPDTEHVIRWEQVEDGSWEATMSFYDPALNYRLYDLDAINLQYLFATVKQFTDGDLPAVYLEPRGSELHRRLAESS